MAAIPLFDSAVLERICDVLADTSSGLTGSEIGKHLTQLGISDPAPAITKRSRLLEALRLRQEQDRCGNLVAAFIQQTMSPVRHTGSKDWFENKRSELNTVLAFAGYELGTDGQFARAPPRRPSTKPSKRPYACAMNCTGVESTPTCSSSARPSW